MLRPFSYRTSGGRKREISLQRIQAVYQYPICEAAVQLGVGVTVLKRYCRWYSIDRWPYRKIRSVDKMIEHVSSTGTESAVAAQVSLACSFLCVVVHPLVLRIHVFVGHATVDRCPCTVASRDRSRLGQQHSPVAPGYIQVSDESENSAELT